MEILTPQEEKFVMRRGKFYKKNVSINLFLLFFSIFITMEVGLCILTAFTPYKFFNLKTAVLGQAFILIALYFVLFVFIKREKKLFKIVKKLLEVTKDS